ncbi:MAG: hypothetical protein RL076_207 [Chloroflexota bacterium]|jgi:uncharacterized protein (TIGR02452 family)
MQRVLNLQLPAVTKEEFVIKRNAAVMIARATKQIVERGNYTTESGSEHDIRAQLDLARAQTVVFSPMQAIPAPREKYKQLVTYVHNQTTLTVAHARQKRGYRVAILNFTQPTTLGGGWLNGRNAQEASLFRSSGLLSCLRNVPWYGDPVHAVNPFYDDTTIVSPNVPIIRAHDGDLLEQPWSAHFISATPIHVRAVRKYMPTRIAEVPMAIGRRTTRIIEAAATTKANVLVLGAWGCGRFGNDPDVVIAAFQAAFESPAIRNFAIIDFAVPDVLVGTPLYQRFRNRLHTQTF